MDDEVVLEARGLTKRFGALIAVDNLSFAVRRGEIFALLGPNGAGKTTTINMICGLIKPSSGGLDFAQASGARESRPSIGLCPQDIVVWDTLTCLEQLVFIAQMHDVAPRIARRRAFELLEALGLTDRRDKLAKTLSGGMRRRLNIALGLVHDPSILVLDEPQAGLDPQSRVLVRDYVRALKRDRTIILTTHDMEEADKLADRVAIIDRGRLLVLDTPQGLKQNDGSEEIIELSFEGAEAGGLESLASGLSSRGFELSRSSGQFLVATRDLVAGIVAVMESSAAAGVAIEDLRIRRRSLEDVFMSLTGRGLRE
ncbi:MAG TPA: ABC transporter ATP-binding protein [Rectinemataceae bacterium]|nr:ABC transporter ATP-binding protein [Rectinemataceae bacterium]